LCLYLDEKEPTHREVAEMVQRLAMKIE